ncbi:MAG: efflux transporter periplasmic adaptor subunit, partial [marine benthic group bacterium]|nr:efflux transporter periplasmic adaptor subunit [Gemmatimonadota bacterium]
GERVEILQGLVPGEEIVASANFLVDAESRLAATGAGGMPGMQHGSHELPEAAPTPASAPASAPAPGSADTMDHSGHDHD